MTAATDRRRRWRDRTGLLAGVGLPALIVAAMVIVDGMGDLRAAYLYREWSGEGIALAWVGVRLLAGGLLALLGVAALMAAAESASRCASVALRGVAVAALAALSGCAAVAVWVSFQSGCIGPCG